MALVRWDSGHETYARPSELNRVLDAFFGNGAARAGRWLPAMDLIETDDHLLLRADLPGLSRDDVEIEIEDRVLTVSGERRTDHEDGSDGYRRVERAFGRFSRSLTLPDGIDADRVAAGFEDGVLEVRIPKPEQRKPHRVAIGAGVNGTATEQPEK